MSPASSKGTIAQMPNMSSKHSALCYVGRDVDMLLTDGLLTTDKNPACIAYINLETIWSLRKERIWRRNPLCGRPNAAVVWMRRIKLAPIQPECEAEDPYITGILVALEQARRRASLCIACRARDRSETNLCAYIRDT